MEEWKNPTTIATWIVIAIVLVLVLAASIALLTRAYIKRTIKFQEEKSRTELEHQRSLLTTSIHIQERERSRIAADLHDDLIGKLHVLLLQTHTPTPLSALTENIEQSIAVARRISHDLSPPLIDKLTFIELVEGLNASWTKAFTIDFYHNNPSTDLSSEKKIQLIRIFQEVFSNIHKHADASIVCLHIRQTSGSTSVVIQDNGKGMNPRTLTPGLGLKNIEMRTQHLGGKFKVSSRRGHGARIILIFPFLHIAKNDA
jgi:two-component system NarL family sensor kinase